MLGRRLSLFKLAGFQVRIDASWSVFALLITWSLARGYFPAIYPGLAEGTYWGLSLVGLLGFAASIVAHELGHAIVARRYELPVSAAELQQLDDVLPLMLTPSL